MSRAEPPRIELLTLPPQGGFPNNQRLPVLVYRAAFRAAARGNGEPLADEIERTFADNGWSGSWRDGVYDYHHFHSTAHEALGCFVGSAEVQVGGPDAPVVALHPGDVLVLPAGTAHRSIQASDDFQVVGGYAGGRSYDMRRAEDGARADVVRAITEVPMPRADPVHGASGPLVTHWAEHGAKRA